MRKTNLLSIKGKGSIDWMNVVKGFAMLGVIFEHWTMVSHESQNWFLEKTVLLTGSGGALVHQFFFLSGFGLTLGYLKRGIPSWKIWFIKRFSKIIVPYWIIITGTYVLALAVGNKYTVGDWFSYITLTRNFFTSGRMLNWSFWFMPVIVGLYAFFPFLIWILERLRASTFLMLSFFLSYGSIAFFAIAGYPVDNHQSAIFFFHLTPFAAGMFLAKITFKCNFILDKLASWYGCFLGFVMVGFSALLLKILTFGNLINDIFTALGFFLILLWIYKTLTNIKLLKPIADFMKLFGKYSYLIYLLHWPLIMYISEPLISRFCGTPIPSVFILIGEAVSVLLLLAIAVMLNNPFQVISQKVETGLTKLILKPSTPN